MVRLIERLPFRASLTLLALVPLLAVVCLGAFVSWNSYASYRELERALALEKLARAGGELMLVMPVEGAATAATRSDIRVKADGTVGFFVPEARFRQLLTNLSPNATANCVLASNHSRGGRFHCSAA